MNRAPLDAGVVAGRAGPFWRSIDVVEQTGSTNADLLTRANSGDDIDGAVLVAEYQSAGRGRHGRHWSAPARSQLSFSVGLSLEGVTPDAWGWLPLAAGVAVVDAVAEAAGVSSGLKWPNDVLAGSVDAPRKLAGILAEVAAPAPAVVVGVGLNVTMTAEEAPDPRATSLHLLGAAQTDRNLLLAAVLRRLADRIGRWRDADGADAELIADYRSRSYTLGSRVRATMTGDQHLEGIARGIDDLGRLQIDTGVGLVTVSAGDIAHLRPTSP